MTGIDSLLLIAFIVVSVVLGKPVSFLNCMALPSSSNAQDSGNSAAWVASLVNNIKHGSTLKLFVWAGSTKMNCLETKAIWGFCIALW